MKKLALILAMLLVVPGAAFGLEMMNDSAMDDVTGQTGVAIAFDDVEVFLNIEQIAWVDVDGVAATGSVGGAVGIENFQIDTLKVNAIVGTSASGNGLYSLGASDVQFDYTGTNAAAGFVAGDAAALTIDVTAALPILTAGHRWNESSTTEAYGGVLIGLPTMEVYIPEMSLEPKFWALNPADDSVIYAPVATVVNSDVAYGRLDLGNITFTLLDGWLEIAPH